MQRLLAFAWIALWFVGAEAAKDVPETLEDESLRIKERKAVIDRESKNLDNVAELAMQEAKQEEEEEKAIERSLAESRTEPISVAPGGAAKKDSEAEKANFKDGAMAKLKKAMENRLKLKAVKKTKEALKTTAETAAALERHRAEQARLKQITAVKKQELQKIEQEEAHEKRLMAKLKQRKLDEEKRLRNAQEEERQQLRIKQEAELRAKAKLEQAHAALKLKAEQRKQAVAAAKDAAKQAAQAQWERSIEKKAGVDLDAFVHKAILKKYGNRLTPEQEKRGEARMKKLVEARLEEKMKARLAERSRPDFHAVSAASKHVKKAPKLRSTERKVREARSHNQDVAPTPKLQQKMFARVQEIAKPTGKVADGSSKVNIEEWIKKAVERKMQKSSKKLSKAATDRLRQSFEKRLRNRLAQQLKAKHSHPAKAMVHVAKHMAKVEANTEAEKDDAEVEGEEDNDAETDSKQDDTTDSGEDDGQDSGDTSSSKDSDGQDSKDQDGAGDDAEDGAEDSSQARSADKSDDKSQEGDSKDDDESDDDQGEAFLQKRRTKKQPIAIIFSTDDPDLQQFFQPRVDAPTHLLATASKMETVKSMASSKKNVKMEAGAAPAAADAAPPAPSPGPAPAPAIDPYKMCDELCKFDNGMDGDPGMCVTDCRVYVDSGGNLRSLKDFVTDETYNEQGGEAMEEHFEKMTGKQIPDCKPTLDLDPNIKFDVVDANGDGKLTRNEMNLWGEKACVPNELAHQIFDAADADFDEEVTPAEYNALGEDTEIENSLDKVVDKMTEGEDQYEPVQMPAFRHVDGNGDGSLDNAEIMTMFKREIRRRIPTLDDAALNALAAEHQQELMDDIQGVDGNKDGLISQDEYEQFHKEGMGSELAEAQAVDNNMPDPDDLSRDPAAPAGRVGQVHAQKMAAEKAAKEAAAKEAAAKEAAAEDASKEATAKATAKGAAKEEKGKQEPAKEEKKAKASFLSQEDE